MAEVVATRRDWVIVIAAIVVFLLHCAVYLQYTVDDSLISYRFARNWAEGFGPVYNPGERVEGYTCFGWVALLAAAHRVGLDMESTSKAMGIAAGVVCILAAAALSRRLLDGRSTYLVAPLVLALSPLFAAWACSGMETALFAALIACSAWAMAVDESRQTVVPIAAVVLGTATFVRPDGMLLAAVALAAIAVGRDKRAGRRAPLRWAATYAAIVAPYMIWRAAYYGSLVPNTYLAKTGRGPERLVSGAWCCANFAEYSGLALAALCVIGLWTPAPRMTAWRFVRMALGAFGAYVIWTGGDILHIRFFVHVMGLLAVCAAVGFDRVAYFDATARAGPFSTRGSRVPRIAMCCALGIAWAATAVVQDFRALHARDQYGAAYVVNNARNVTLANIPLGKWLAAHAPTDATAAVWDIGGVGYYSNLRIIDLYGLTDSTLARMIHCHASDARKVAYVESRRPDYIVAYAGRGGANLQWLEPLGAQYRLLSYWRGGPDGYGLALLVRKSTAECSRLTKSSKLRKSTS